MQALVDDLKDVCDKIKDGIIMSHIFQHFSFMVFKRFLFHFDEIYDCSTVVHYTYELYDPLFIFALRQTFKIRFCLFTFTGPNMGSFNRPKL